jgi:hypothetical protein
VPVQAPDATQDLTSLVLQVIVAALPDLMVLDAA